MKERPILMSGPMVRALLDGRKTQTRRMVKPQPELSDRVGFVYKGMAYGLGGSFDPKGLRNLNCRNPYGQPGDRLWVRETWQVYSIWNGSTNGNGIKFRADGVKNEILLPMPIYQPDPEHKWRPSIFMPRWASRITLEIVSVRVERLQEISEADAKAEGVSWDQHWEMFAVEEQFGNSHDPRISYSYLWEFINGEGSWDANPWVWVVEFKRI